MKIIINKSYGCFEYGEAAIKLAEIRGGDITSRTCPIMVEIIEELGSYVASGQFSDLNIVEIPDDVDWEVKDYDGSEWIAERHRTWR